MNFFISYIGSFESVSSKWYKLACATIKDSDQLAHPYNLIRVFDGCSIGSQGSNIYSVGKLTLCSYCVDAQSDLNLCFKHMPTHTLCWTQVSDSK